LASGSQDDCRNNNEGDDAAVEAVTGEVTTQHVVIAVPPALAIETIESRPELSAELIAAPATAPV